MSPPKTITAFPSSYIPWKGYFDVINSVDEFVLYDDTTYVGRDWRNRNLIKSARGLSWMTIPVEASAPLGQRVCDVRVTDGEWRAAHWRALTRAYSDAPHFKTYAAELRAVYASATHDRLSRINHDFIATICKFLGIRTPITWSMSYALPAGDPHERLLTLCRESQAGCLLAGAGSRRYLDIERFQRAGIRVRFADYARYPSYPQSHPPFEHRVSVLDLLFNTGPAASGYMKSFGAAPSPTGITG